MEPLTENIPHLEKAQPTEREKLTREAFASVSQLYAESLRKTPELPFGLTFKGNYLHVNTGKPEELSYLGGMPIHPQTFFEQENFYLPVLEESTEKGSGFALCPDGTVFPLRVGDNGKKQICLESLPTCDGKAFPLDEGIFDVEPNEKWLELGKDRQYRHDKTLRGYEKSLLTPEDQGGINFFIEGLVKYVKGTRS